jgi:hypothetical protein
MEASDTDCMTGTLGKENIWLREGEVSGVLSGGLLSPFKK